MHSSSGCSSEHTEPFALRVLGESMLPEFRHGDIIIVDPGHPVCHGAYAVIEYKGDVHFGQYIENNASKWIQFLNDEQQNFELSSDFILKGVVTQRSNGRRKYLKHYQY